jgi:hypothetical protein
LTNNIRTAATESLTAALITAKGDEACDGRGYAHALADNLVDGLSLDDFQADFAEGAGQELEGKMRAAYSSSALAVNCFGRWASDPSSLTICGQTGFSKLQFEAKCPTGVGRMPPHLDLVLTGPDGVLAIESKCTEYMNSHKAKFADAYVDNITDHRTKTGWYAEMLTLREQPDKYRFLDAAQLIKHYFGLAHTYPETPITLIYLFWEPANGGDFNDIKKHRAEINIFSEAVANSEVSFQSLSYPELWEGWESQDQPSWLGQHLSNLNSRYLVNLT